jgi:hypothetical protein
MFMRLRTDVRMNTPKCLPSVCLIVCLIHVPHLLSPLRYLRSRRLCVKIRPASGAIQTKTDQSGPIRTNPNPKGVATRDWGLSTQDPRNSQ